MADLKIGLISLEFAEVAADGGPGTVFEALGQTLEDSLSITKEDGTMTTINVEETDLPIFEQETLGSTTIVFDCPNPDMEVFAKLTGGTYEAVSGKYSSANSVSQKEWTLKITASQGGIISYNRCKVKAAFQGSLGKNNALSVNVSLRVLQPTKAGVAFEEITNP